MEGWFITGWIGGVGGREVEVLEVVLAFGGGDLWGGYWTRWASPAGKSLESFSI
jgi:hypothetical protein